MAEEPTDLVDGLRATLGNLEAAFAVLSDAIAWIDRGGKIGWCNAAFDRLVGRPHPEVLDRQLVRLLPLEQAGKPVDEEHHPARMALDARASGSSVFEFRDRRGAPQDLEISWSHLELDGGAAVGIVCVRDVTERRRYERRLELSEKKFRQLLEFAPDGVLVVDAKGAIMFANEQIARIFGYEPGELLGGAIELLLPERTRERHVAYREGYLAKPVTRPMGVACMELAGRRKDGSEVPVSIALSPVHDDRSSVIAVVRDDTERKRAEGTLRKANRAYRTLSECNQALIRATDEQGWLERMCRIVVEHGGYRMAWVGYAMEDKGKSVRPMAWAGFEEGYLKLLDATWLDAERGQGPVGTAIRTREPYIAQNVRADPRFSPWRDDAVRRGYASMTALPLIAENGVFGVLAIYAAEPDAFDEGEMKLLTELAGDMAYGVASLRARVEHEAGVEALRESEERFRQSQKMEAIGRLAGGVAHDFNNLLTAIMGYCNLIQMGSKSRDSLLDDLGEIAQAAQRAAALTRQLLAFSRKQVLTPRVLDLNTVVTDVSKMLRRIIGEDIDLDLRLTSDVKRIEVDSGQMEQVIMNLAVNARDAMPTGGKLIIETSNIAFDERSPGRHDVIPPGSYVVLSVSDTGCGMDEATKSHLFEPFFTTKEQGKGTGLGLSTIYGIVKQSGGYIWVYSEAGKGSSFKIYLPSTEKAAATVGRELAGSTSVRGSETVLLVEDDTAVRNMLSRALRLNGYRVIEAKNGTEGLQTYERHSGEVRLVVTDVVMPEGGGKVMGDRIQALGTGAGIIYMSGYTDEAILHHGQFGPGTVFLQKPLTPGVFLAKVRQVLDEQPAKGKDASCGP